MYAYTNCVRKGSKNKEQELFRIKVQFNLYWAK